MLKIAVQMDHIAGINIAGDSTFAMLLEASARGHSLFHYTPDQLSYLDGVVTAPLAPLQVRDTIGDHFTLGPAELTDLSTMDVVLLRQDPPFDLAYITTTHLLELIHPKTLVVNDPAAVRNAPEKVLVLDFRAYMPPTLITRSIDAVRAFREEHQDIIIKPLHGHGGRNVFRLQPGDQNLGALIGLFSGLYREPFMVQTYLPAVRDGDKRILLVDGEPVGGVNRIPAADDTRSNMVQGGRAEATQLTDRELEICEALGPELKRRGLLFVGIDVIGDYLTEINVTSPTGIRSVENLSQIPVSKLFWNTVEARL